MPNVVNQPTYNLLDFFPDCVLPNCPDFSKVHQHILPHQQTILDSASDYLYCQGGVGSAKSVAFAVKSVYLSLTVPENSGVVTRKDFKLLYKSSWLDIKRVIKRLVQKNIIPAPKMSDKRQGDYTTIEFHNASLMYAMQGKNWSEGLGASYGWLWVDDAMESYEEMFVGDETSAGLLSRLRLPYVRYFRNKDGTVSNKLHGMVSSNPPPVGHWLHRLFGSRVGMHRIGDQTVEWMLVGTHENPFVGIDYAKGLMAIQDKMGRNKNVARRVIFGESIPAYGGVPVFPEFIEEVHVAPLQYDAALPLLRAWDFGYHHPAVVFANLYKCQYQFNHYLCLSEVSDQLAVNVWDLYKAVKQHTLTLDKSSKLILDAGDRAGYRMSDANKDRRGPIRILKKDYKSDNIKFRFRFLDLANSLEYMRGLLKKTCKCDMQMILISPDCKVLIGALQGGYKYSKDRQGKISDKPVEDRWFADVACAWRYGAENFVKWGVPYDVQDTVQQQTSAYKTQFIEPWAWMDMPNTEMAKIISR